MRGHYLTRTGFVYLEAAVSERHPALAKRVMGGLDLAPIGDDPRFRALLQRMGSEGAPDTDSESGPEDQAPLRDHPCFQALLERHAGDVER
jgi:hypothetical protein